MIGTSLGGVIDAEEAARSAVKLINSGPSMAPVAARVYWPRDEAIIVGDAGGTTFDVSLVRDGRIPPHPRETGSATPYRSHMTGMPSVDVKSVGAAAAARSPGATRAASFISGRKAPDRCPAPPATARAASGRPSPTRPSCWGFIDPGLFLSGSMALDRGAAARAIEGHVAGRIGKDGRGGGRRDRRSRYGAHGSGDPRHHRQPGDRPCGVGLRRGRRRGRQSTACGLRSASAAGGSSFPETGAALSAAGAVISELSSFLQAVHYTTSQAFDMEGVAAILSSLEAAGRDFLGSGPPLPEDRFVWSAEARYPDQAWEIEVPLRAGRMADGADVGPPD